MNNAKYILFEHPMLEIPVIFPMHISHATMAARMALQPISAGFVRLVEGEPECFGESITLLLKSRPEDTQLLRRILGLRK